MKLVQKGTGVILSSRLRNALFVLFIGGILAYGAEFAWYMLSHFDLINLISNTYDDAFYYFQIARNLAEGKFSTFDGGTTRTNGYHPIWLFLITPFYWAFDREAALFAIKALEIMLVAGGVALVAAAARLARLPWVLMFAALPMLYQQHQQYWLLLGMEAAAALFMLGLFVLTVCLFARSPARWKWPLAAVAFALPWVRLEYIAISLATTGALCLIEWSWQDRPSGASFGERARSALSFKSIVPLLAASAGVLAYFAYNRLVFGGIVPVSGAVKQMLSQRLWERKADTTSFRTSGTSCRFLSLTMGCWLRWRSAPTCCWSGGSPAAPGVGKIGFCWPSWQACPAWRLAIWPSSHRPFSLRIPIGGAMLGTSSRRT